MRRTYDVPLNILIDLARGTLEEFEEEVVRRASHLRGIFADGVALERVIAAGDPVVYEVRSCTPPEAAGHLAICSSVIHSGRVGLEYHMTKGHYHVNAASGEIYICVRGRGYVLLQDNSGRTEELPLSPGTVSYVPPGWAHRTVNTGDSPLSFIGVYPADAGHDYGTILATGMKRTVMDDGGVPTPVDVSRLGLKQTG